MTRFMWWTLTWFLLGYVWEWARVYEMGWLAFDAMYPNGVRAAADITNGILWIVLWHTIVKKERQ